jgi:hypothetical protein
MKRSTSKTIRTPSEYRHAPATICCEQLQNAVRDPTIPIVFVPKFREYGIQVFDGGSSYIQIEYCPWCRAKLPKSLRAKWLRAIRALGFEPGDKKVPPEYLDERWYAG